MDKYIEQINKIQKQLKKDLSQSDEKNSLTNISKYNLDLFAEYMEHFRELYMEEGSKFNADKEDLDENYHTSYLPNIWLNQILQFIVIDLFNDNVELTKEFVINHLNMIEDVMDNEHENDELQNWLNNVKPSDF